MSEYSIPVSREISPPVGKRKKLSTACDACQKRKSRCEMITSKGCHRCRTLGTTCSRAGGEDSCRVSETSGSVKRSNSPSIDQTSSFALEDLQARTRRMEGMLSLLLRQSGAPYPPASSHTQIETSGSVFQEDERANTQSPAAVANRALHLRGTSFMRDPITLGLINYEQWEAVYSDFLTCIRLIIPLDTLFDAWGNTDPFLRTCVLVYQANHTSINQNIYEKLLATLRANLDRLPLVRPTRPIILALLILSLTPPYHGDGRSFTPADRFGAGSRAVDLARCLGLERAVDRVVRESPEDWDREWMKADLNDMKLWYSVSHRARLIDLYNSSSLLIRPSPTNPIPAPPASFVDPLFSHLSLENQLLSLLDYILCPFHSMCTARVYDPTHADALEQAILEYTSMTKNWRDEVNKSHLKGQGSSASYLILTQYLFDILLFLRLTDWTNLPTPLGPEIISRFARGYANRIHISSTSALHVILSLLDHHPAGRIPILDVLPGFTFTLVILAYKVVSQSHKLNEQVPTPSTSTTQSQVNSPTSASIHKPDQILITPDQLVRIKAALGSSYTQYIPLLASIDGEDAPHEWGGAMRDLILSGGEADTVRWEDWERMFDFDLYFGLQGQSGWDMGGGIGTGQELGWGGIGFGSDG